MAAPGGLDGFVFTSGIGEHNAAVRQKVVDPLAWLGLSLAPNAPSKGLVSPKDAPVEVWEIPTDEEAVIARQTRAITDSA